MPTREQIEEDSKLTPEERAQKLDEAKAAYKAVDVDSVPKSQVHTYPDGTQVVGVPPFPAQSPKERAEANLERVGVPADPVPQPMVIPPGMQTSGAPAPSPVGGHTLDQLAAKAQEQLDSDVLSGKSPNVPNPTTDSNKPELAGTAGTDLDNTISLGDTPTPEELAKIAADIKPTGEAVEGQADAAVLQVLRETKGPIVEDEPAKTASKTTKK